MKLNRKKRIPPGESGASSDLAFLLIIYFLVIAGFNINEGFLMNLPARNSTRVVLKDDLMRFDMGESGALTYGGAELSITEAERAILTAAADHPNLALALSIDGKAPWQNVVLFVELAQKLKVDAFSFTMKESP